MNKVICGNALEELKKLADNSIDCIITSPPYWQKIRYEGLPNYKYPNGFNGQLGLEPTFQQYLNNLILFFDETKRILKPQGTLWVNMGDTYGGSGNGTNDYSKPNTTLNNLGKQAKKLKTNGGARSATKKNLLLIPHRFAIMMQDKGWILRNDIVWAKRNAMPESVKDRFTKKHEYVFFFTKGKDYYFDLDAVREAHSETSKKRNKYPNNYKGAWSSIEQSQSLSKNGKNPSDVTDFWDIPNKGKKDMHFASYSQTLVARPILAGCPKGGIVLDFFAGTGTTGVTAKNLGRNYILIEGSKKYCAMIEKNLKSGALDNSLSGIKKPTYKFYAPLQARKNAINALKRRKELPISKQGLKEQGLKRAEQLANNKIFTLNDLKVMQAWFARHYQTSYKSPKYRLRENAWVAWNGWGGTHAQKWVNDTLKEYKLKK